MKKKIILTALLLLLVAGAVVTIFMVKNEIKERKRTPEEKAFEAKVKELYGERNYLGPMTEEIEPLTEEELKELNPEEEPYIKYHKMYPDITYICGRFNKKKIRDVYDAREAAYQAIIYAEGIVDKDMLLYWDLCPGRGNIKDYRFYRHYKGVRVYMDYVEVSLDEEKNCYVVGLEFRPDEEITLDSVEPVYQGAKLEAFLEEKYGKCSILEKELYVCKYGEEYGLKWYLHIDAPESPIDFLWMNANTGETWWEYEAIDVY